MIQVQSKRIIPTPGAYAREHFYYVQEIGTLTSKSPHISTRKNIYSYLFLVVEKGSGYFSYDGVRFQIHTGDCIFIDCRLPYAHESSEKDPWTLSWVHFYGTTLHHHYEQFKSSGCSCYFHPNDTSVILSTLSALYSQQETKSATSDILTHKYLTDIVTFCFTENKAKEETLSLQNKLQKIREYLENNYEKRLSLEHISESFYISKFHLSREYKRHFGVTLNHDLNSMRISKAKSMLRFTTESMDSIAEQCGFSDTAYFIKVFKTAENTTPAAFRKSW